MIQFNYDKENLPRLMLASNLRCDAYNSNNFR